MPQLAGEDILASDILTPQIRFKAVTETLLNSSTLQNDDDFLFALTPGLYSLDLWLHASNTSSSAADIKVAWTNTGTMTFTRACIGPDVASTDVLGGTMRCSAHNIGTSVSYGITGATGTVTAVIKEELTINCTVAGNLQLQWAQNTATGGITTSVSTASRVRLLTLETF